MMETAPSISTTVPFVTLISIIFLSITYLLSQYDRVTESGRVWEYPTYRNYIILMDLALLLAVASLAFWSISIFSIPYWLTWELLAGVFFSLSLIIIIIAIFLTSYQVLRGQ